MQTERAATAATVAGRVDTAGCSVVAWIGGSEALDELLAALREPIEVVGTSRLKTDDGLLLASPSASLFTECGCVDVSLSIDERLQRFVHDFQADGGSAPGPFAVEAYDVGRLLIGFASRAAGGRRWPPDSRSSGFTGLDSLYRFARDGSRAPEPLEVVLARSRFEVVAPRGDPGTVYRLIALLSTRVGAYHPREDAHGVRSNRTTREGT